MMNFLLKAIIGAIDRYSGREPLAAFLKKYFRHQPRLGARDRKSISEAVYIYYRCAAFLPAEHPPLDVIAWGMLRCGRQNRFLADRLANAGIPQNQELSVTEQKTKEIWRQEAAFSKGISRLQWQEAMYHQPALFIRPRKPIQKVLQGLQEKRIPYRPVGTIPESVRKSVPPEFPGKSLQLENGTRLSEILPDTTYVVQDWASQAAMAVAISFAAVAKASRKRQDRFSAWDVCAGAGGKSIFWKDQYPDDELLVTDIRKKILAKLRERFKLYGISNYKGLQTDAADNTYLAAQIGTTCFDFIICDVPCSGSGTWRRTPEEFYYFRENDLKQYAEVQYAISRHAQQHLRPGGLLFYITCSVFRQENEAVVARLVNKTNLELQHQELVNGLSVQGDALFIAVLRRK